VTRIALALAAVLALAGCAAPTPNSTPTATITATAEPVTAASVAAKIKTAVPGVWLIPITDANDPNNLLGRPTGYVAAVIVNDKRVTCDSLGTDCGATVEQWPTAADATARSEYIQSILKGGTWLGSEYDYVDGVVLIRVSGALKPSQAKAYDVR